MTLHTRTVMAAALGLTLVTAGCGSDGGPTVAAISSGTPSAKASASATGTASREATMAKFAQCMRGNGVPDFPDPTVDAKGNPKLNLGETMKGKMDDPSVTKALAACKTLRDQLRDSGTDDGNSQQRADALLAYAKCMRQNGMPDFPDPNTTEKDGEGEFSGVDRNAPAFTKADAICRKTLGSRNAD